QVDDRVGLRRHPRRRPGPAQGAAEALRVAEAGARRHRRGAGGGRGGVRYARARHPRAPVAAAAARQPPAGGGDGGLMSTATTEGPEVAIITGLSGAGRTTAAKVLEDLGYFVIDNMPPALLERVVDLAS